MSEHHGPRLRFAEELHAQKYRGEGESFREAMGRVAGALSDNPAHFRALREILLDMRFLPAGRVQAAMGSTRQVTPYNCFVSGVIEDSFVDGHGSIMGRAAEAAATMRMGGGIGYDFSTLRPRGATIRKLNSRSSGPVTFMEIYDAICRCVASSGHRRGAQMGVLRVDHPDIEEFIHSKQNRHRLTGFNISVAVTDEFMRCLLADRPFPLRFGGEVFKTVRPGAIWETLMRSTWDWAEPGVLFIDRVNEMNNLAYCETIAATNPCGEQPLPPNGACLLGSFNLARYVRDLNGRPMLDIQRLALDVPPVVRAMDNVVDRAIYPLFEQEKEARSKRRMGLGVTGVANALEVLGWPYASEGYLEAQGAVLKLIRDHAYNASALLAREKGPFPLYQREAYLDSRFVSTLPPRLRDRLAMHGIRNSHLLSIAPTGTISLAADNVSSGIEPVFSHRVERTVFMDDGPRQEVIEDYGARVWGHRGRTAEELSPREHLAVLRAAAPLVDSAVSKTCNVSSGTAWEAFKQLYVDAWRAGCKGCTTYTVGGRREGVLVSDEEERDETPPAACHIDPDTGRRECE